MISTLFLF